MTDPPTGGPEPSPTNTRRGAQLFTLEEFEPIVPRKRRSPRNRNEATTVAYSDPEFAGSQDNNGRVTTKEVHQLIHSLKEIITHQTTVIESTKAEILEVKHDQNILRDQNDKLREEIQALREQIEGQKTPSLSRSWAAVAADANNLESRENRRRTEKEKNCVRISTRQAPTDTLETEDNGSTFGRYLTTPEANNHIRTALLNTPSTQDIKVAGIGTTRTGYIVRFTDPESAETARNNTEWLQELGNETKLVKPRHGVVVHHLPTQGLDLERDKARAIKKITDENNLTERGFQIEDIAWLKKRDKDLGAFASMGIWFDSAKAAEWMLGNGLLIDQRYIGRIEKYKAKEGRCFRCQRFGHQAWSCKEKAPRCGHCGGPHERARCPPGVRARCLECSGEHPTGDVLCPTPTAPLSSQC